MTDRDVLSPTDRATVNVWQTGTQVEWEARAIISRLCDRVRDAEARAERPALTDRADLVEALSAYAHEAWLGWMRYQRQMVWDGWMSTPYAELPEAEKYSDRMEARTILAIIDRLTAAAMPQPAPVGTGEIILPLVIADIQARADAGIAKYGTRLRAHNGRDALMDAYQEAIDQTMYLRQALEERLTASQVELAPGVAAPSAENRPADRNATIGSVQDYKSGPVYEDAPLGMPVASPDAGTAALEQVTERLRTMSGAEYDALFAKKPAPPDESPEVAAEGKRIVALLEADALRARIRELEADKLRMDYLEAEPVTKVGTLFRHNRLITRASIDAARHAIRGPVAGEGGT